MPRILLLQPRLVELISALNCTSNTYIIYSLLKSFHLIHMIKLTSSQLSGLIHRSIGRAFHQHLSGHVFESWPCLCTEQCTEMSFGNLTLCITLASLIFTRLNFLNFCEIKGLRTKGAAKIKGVKFSDLVI